MYNFELINRVVVRTPSELAERVASICAFFTRAECSTATASSFGLAGSVIAPTVTISQLRLHSSELALWRTVSFLLPRLSTLFAIRRSVSPPGSLAESSEKLNPPIRCTTRAPRDPLERARSKTLHNVSEYLAAADRIVRYDELLAECSPWTSLRGLQNLHRCTCTANRKLGRNSRIPNACDIKERERRTT